MKHKFSKKTEIMRFFAQLIESNQILVKTGTVYTKAKRRKQDTVLIFRFEGKKARSFIGLLDMLQDCIIAAIPIY